MINIESKLITDYRMNLSDETNICIIIFHFSLLRRVKIWLISRRYFVLSDNVRHDIFVFDDGIFEEIVAWFGIAHDTQMMRLDSLMIEDMCSLKNCDIILESVVFDYGLYESWI